LDLDDDGDDDVHVAAAAVVVHHLDYFDVVNKVDRENKD
jgi:hypothetical protein